MEERGKRSSTSDRVKLLLDMNLSPFWATVLEKAGFETVHWSQAAELENGALVALDLPGPQPQYFPACLLDATDGTDSRRKSRLYLADRLICSESGG
jgi:hypothetical protein